MEEPHWQDYNDVQCLATSEATIKVTNGSVAAGSWQGEEAFALGIPLPAGFELSTNGKLTYNSSETVTVNVETTIICNAGPLCTVHDGSVGPGYKTKTATTQYTQECWLQSSSLLCPWPFCCKDEKCAEFSFEHPQASVTYLSSQLVTEVLCGRAMTPEEEAACCNCPQ